MLLTHSARAVLRTWAPEIQARTHHNKVACALANKLSRVCYVMLCCGITRRLVARSRVRKKAHPYGYTTACVIQRTNLSISFLVFRGSPYTRVRRQLLDASLRSLSVYF
jgi:hypothetical protein